MSLNSCSTASYVVDQGIGQWRLLNRARPIDQVLQSPFTPEHTKWAIGRVLAAKKYAVEQIGLKATSNYKRYVALDQPYVTYVVSAADPLLLESKTWHFPFVGEVPYLGFFKREQAEAFAKKLKQSEQPTYDIWLRGASAFSSLGWFPDPLYSSMIERAGERDIFEVVIHESLHATVWVGDSVDFNESLANFVGLTGSLNYIASAYPAREGGSSAELEAAREELEREKIFATFVEASIARYKREVRSLEQKDIFYKELAPAWSAYFKSHAPNGLKSLHEIKFEDWNNAALLSYGNYYRDYSVFEKVLARCHGDLRRFVAWINGETKKGGLMNSAPLDRLATMASENCLP